MAAGFFSRPFSPSLFISANRLLMSITGRHRRPLLFLLLHFPFVFTRSGRPILLLSVSLFASMLIFRWKLANGDGGRGVAWAGRGCKQCCVRAGDEPCCHPSSRVGGVCSVASLASKIPSEGWSRATSQMQIFWRGTVEICIYYLSQSGFCYFRAADIRRR